MYNRYIPHNSHYTPIEEPEQPAHTAAAGREKPDRQPLTALLKRLRLDELDSGDILLLLIVLLLWKRSGDTDLLLALGGAMLLGEEE